MTEPRRLICYPFLHLFQRGSHALLLPLLGDDHSNTNIHDVLTNWEDPEVTRVDLVDEMNLYWTSSTFTALNARPVFSVASTEVLIITEGLIEYGLSDFF